LGLGILAFIVSKSFAESEGFFERALYAYTIYGAGITPALVAALFWKGATKEGAVASITFGTIVTLLWKEIPDMWTWLPIGIYGSVDEVLPAIFCSVIALVGISLVTKK